MWRMARRLISEPKTSALLEDLMMKIRAELNMRFCWPAGLMKNLWHRQHECTARVRSDVGVKSDVGGNA